MWNKPYVMKIHLEEKLLSESAHADCSVLKAAVSFTLSDTRTTQFQRPQSNPCVTIDTKRYNHSSEMVSVLFCCFVVECYFDVSLFLNVLHPPTFSTRFRGNEIKKNDR